MKPRFQFRLRTLMIVVTLLALPCAYIGHQVRVVQKRKLVMEWITTHHGEVALKRRNPAGGPDVTPSIPWIRRILGDEPVAGVYFTPRLNAEDAARIKETFPEMEELARALPDDQKEELPRTRSYDTTRMACAQFPPTTLPRTRLTVRRRTP